MIKISIVLFILTSFVFAERPDPSCLQCICQATSNCDTINLKCPTGSDYETNCGPYQISRYYWEEGNAIGYDFETCVNLKACAERVIINYMKKYSRDCNGDGVIDCIDYAAIHRMGVDRCSDPSLFESAYWQVFSQTQCVVNPSLEPLQKPALSSYQPQKSYYEPQQTFIYVPNSYPNGQNSVSYYPTSSVNDSTNRRSSQSPSQTPGSTKRRSHKKRKNQTSRRQKPKRPSTNETSLVVPNNNHPVIIDKNESPSIRSGNNIPFDNQPKLGNDPGYEISSAPFDPSHYSTHRPTYSPYPTRRVSINGDILNDDTKPREVPRRSATPRTVPSSFNQPISPFYTSEVTPSDPSLIPSSIHPSYDSGLPSPMVPPSASSSHVPPFESPQPYPTSDSLPESSPSSPSLPPSVTISPRSRPQTRKRKRVNQVNNRRTSRNRPSSSQPLNPINSVTMNTPSITHQTYPSSSPPTNIVPTSHVTTESTATLYHNHPTASPRVYRPSNPRNSVPVNPPGIINEPATSSSSGAENPPVIVYDDQPTLSTRTYRPSSRRNPVSDMPPLNIPSEGNPSSLPNNEPASTVSPPVILYENHPTPSTRAYRPSSRRNPVSVKPPLSIPSEGDPSVLPNNEPASTVSPPVILYENHPTPSTRAYRPSSRRNPVSVKPPLSIPSEGDPSVLPNNEPASTASPPVIVYESHPTASPRVYIPSNPRNSVTVKPPVTIYEIRPSSVPTDDSIVSTSLITIKPPVTLYVNRPTPSPRAYRPSSPVTVKPPVTLYETRPTLYPTGEPTISTSFDTVKPPFSLYENRTPASPTTSTVTYFAPETAKPTTTPRSLPPSTLDFRNDFDAGSTDSLLPSNPIPPHLTNKTLTVSDQCLSCLCESTESCQNKVGCSNPEGPCGPYQVTLEQWIIAGKPKNNFQKCASSLDCSRGILRRFLTKHGLDCNADSDVNCVDFALIHKYGLDNCKVIPEDLFKSGYWLNFENCYGFDRK